MERTSVSLVCMPWQLLGSPSIQIGTLHAALERAKIPCRSHSLHLEFMRFLSEDPQCDGLGLEEYCELASRWMNLGAGEWLFAIPAIRERTRERDDRFFDLCRADSMPKDLLRDLRRVRERVPIFLERCADEILAADPAVVGFSVVYSQALPSAALAHMLKTRAPHLTIVFGGASCEGPMGPALLRAFEAVDVVLRGEGERGLFEIVQSVLAGASIPRCSGIVLREGAEIVAVDTDESARVAMDDVPLPVYDEYFERLAHMPLAQQILPHIPYEAARGCWWGEKAHCTFCGLNGMTMTFRSKSAERVLDDVSALARRHGVLDFMFTDNILDMKYFDSVLPKLAARGEDLNIFLETKANLTEAHVEALRAAGMRTIQPGIESLSTPTLQLMKKGVSALQNIRLLKWCARHGIRVVWNLLYGFPGESPEEYARMAELIPSLVHLEPPNLSPLMVYRFSPYHARPAEHGIELGAPLPFYGLLYDVDDACLADLAHVFEFTHADGRDPESYVRPLRARVERWKREWETNRGALSYRRGPGFLVIVDTRTTSPAPARYTLGEEEADAFLACDAGMTVDGILRQCAKGHGSTMTETRLRGLLQDFVDARLVYEERGRYLSLAVAQTSLAATSTASLAIDAALAG